MATKIETEYPSSPQNDDPDEENEETVESQSQVQEDEAKEEENKEDEAAREVEEDSREQEEFRKEEESIEEEESREEEEETREEEKVRKPVNNNVEDILKRLRSTGALIKKPKKEYLCFSCDLDFPDWGELENHLIQHVSLPSVVIDKLPSDDEETALSGDDNWSDEDEESSPSKAEPSKTPQKLDISQILKKTGLSIKKPSESPAKSTDSALNKLSGLGFTIKKNVTQIKKEKPDSTEKSKDSDVMHKIGKLGGIKLKLKSDGNNTNTFKVVNGLKDFKTSDDEDGGSGNEDTKDEQESADEENDKSDENSASADEEAEERPQNRKKRKNSENNESQKTPQKVPNLPKGIQGKLITPKKEPGVTQLKIAPVKPPAPETQAKPSGRPTVKQTPKRGANLPISTKEPPKQLSSVESSPKSRRESVTSTPERRESRDTNVENVIVKQEVQENSNADAQTPSMPLFSGQIKSERASPPIIDNTSTPIIARVKTEPESYNPTSQPKQQNTTVPSTSAPAAPLLPVTKTEDTGVTIIEINGDSNDEDDDCCVVSATPAPDVKPIIPKIEPTLPTAALPQSYPTPSSYSTPQSSYNTSSRLSSTPSTEKQHTFNWNAPDSKPAIDILEKSTDDIFESLLSSATKKENLSSLSDASEYISLDTLGPQHSCEVCNTRFTDISLLEDHKRMTGHSQSLVPAPSASSLMPYNPSSNSILSSLLPVKQLAEQVGKLSGMNSGPGFTHQQNVMINIQAYPGGGGIVPPQPYNSYGNQNMHPGYQQPANNMYGAQTMPGQYPTSSYMNSGYGQYGQSPMSKGNYPGTMPPNTYSTASPQYSAASPLQSMQQAVYGQSPGMMSQAPGQMGPPGSSPGHSYIPTSSLSGTMKPPSSSGIRIQNVQTFPPGQLVGNAGAMPGQQLPGVDHSVQSGQPGQMLPPGPQMPAPTQIRMAPGANVAGQRPRMPTIRGQRPSIRPGIQVHGQVRGLKPGGPRPPMKRPGAMAGGPGQKRRNDMLLPGKHDNEDCQVMAMQKQRDGLPMIHSVQGAKDKLNLGSQISITKKPVNKEANAMANVLASRGISVKQKQKSRSPTPERPLPHIPNLGAGVSIKHMSKSSNFSIPEAKVGGGMLSCKICKKMFMNHSSLSVHMSNAHPQSKIPVFKCDECPASYPKSLQLQHHKRVFHNVSGPNRELGLPVVDLSQEDNLKRLSSLGIYSFIPLANREQASGCFGIPVISVHNGLTSGLQALGADGVLSLGPLKPLPNA